MSSVFVSEVLVVGAGIAGTTVALQLARPGARIVVAERGPVGISMGTQEVSA